MDVIIQVVIRGRVQGIGFRAWTDCHIGRSLNGLVLRRRSPDSFEYRENYRTVGNTN